jgi:hypothetical protein
VTADDEVRFSSTRAVPVVLVRSVNVEHAVRRGFLQDVAVVASLFRRGACRGDDPASCGQCKSVKFLKAVRIGNRKRVDDQQVCRRVPRERLAGDGCQVGV